MLSHAADGWVIRQEYQVPTTTKTLGSNDTQLCYCTTSQERDSYDEDGSGITPSMERTLSYLRLLNIKIPQPDEIRNYLTDHSDMLYLLSALSETARLKFRAPAKLFLELNQDSDIDDEYLILYVRQDEYDTSVMKQIKQIRREYGKMMADLSGWLLLTTDFCPPGEYK